MDAVPKWRVGDPAPAPLPRRSEADVIARWRDGPPLVSVLCPTYQHVGFIEDALRGFLGQDTDFPFEVLVRDDASTDGTAEIVQDYANRYPGVVRAILEARNSYPTVSPFARLRDQARGEFISACEGDDYWISPDKLQRQVELLRGRPDIAVAVNVGIAIRDGVILSAPGDVGWSELSPWQLKRAPVVGIRETCFRATGAPPSPLESRLPGLDMFIFNRLGLIGGALRTPDLVATAFRVHPGGIWSSRTREEKAILLATTHYWIGAHFKEMGDSSAARHHIAKAATIVLRSFLSEGVDPRPGLLLGLLRALPGIVVRRLPGIRRLAARFRRTS